MILISNDAEYLEDEDGGDIDSIQDSDEIKQLMDNDLLKEVVQTIRSTVQKQDSEDLGD